MKEFPQILAQSVLRPGGVVILGLTDAYTYEGVEHLKAQLRQALPEAAGVIIIYGKIPCLFIINVEDGLAAEREACAALAERIGDQFHDDAIDPQEDSSNRAGEAIAAAIRARAKEQP